MYKTIYGDYRIYSDGRITSLKYGNERELKVRGKGYKRVDLMIDGEKHTFLFHRLLAEAFIPNPENKPCIDHINGVKDDNRLENLKWATHKENNNNPITRPKFLENHPTHPVICITDGKEFKSIKAACSYYQIKKTTLRESIVQGFKVRHKLEFKFKE